jgi:hypothetical protein
MSFQKKARLYENLALKRFNGKILITVEFALLRKNNGKRSKKYGTHNGRRINSEPLYCNRKNN